MPAPPSAPPPTQRVETFVAHPSVAQQRRRESQDAEADVPIQPNSTFSLVGSVRSRNGCDGLLRREESMTTPSDMVAWLVPFTVLLGCAAEPEGNTLRTSIPSHESRFSFRAASTIFRGERG